MVKWKRYRDFGRINQMRNEGRELVGETIYWTEKRDGSNISFWIGEDELVHVSSHNMEKTGDDLQNKVVLTDEWAKISCEIMQEQEFQNCIFYFELIPAGKGPTRIEPKHKRPRLVLIDIYNTITEQYLTYNYIHQVAHKYKIPIVKLVDATIPRTLDELYEQRDRMLKWCKRHRREGVVGKCWKSTDELYESFFFKEKIDLPAIKKTLKPTKDEIQLPQMPDEKIFNAIDQAREECERAGNEFKNPKYAMPLVANHLNTQAREHNYAVPSGFYKLYSDYLDRRRTSE